MVAEQQLLAFAAHHRHRRVQALDHRDEALVGRLQHLLRVALLGHVGQRCHPAGLVAIGVDQWRNQHLRVEALAVLALHYRLEQLL
ncbi:hypothetical protein D3C85_1433210 [compost metagenome]